jgi:hypothetical protein
LEPAHKPHSRTTAICRDLTDIGGKGSALHQKHKVHLDAVTVALPPENYEERLVPMFPGA